MSPQDIFDVWLQKGPAARGRALGSKVGRTGTRRIKAADDAGVRPA